MIMYKTKPSNNRYSLEYEKLSNMTHAECHRSNKTTDEFDVTHIIITFTFNLF